MFDKILQKATEKILPLILEGQKLHKKAMLVNAMAVLMGNNQYGEKNSCLANDPTEAYKTAKKIVELVETI